jgi:hypothetical protein
VAASTISNHLAILLEHEQVTALARLAPRTAITSLRQHTKATALRNAGTCCRHLVGQLGARLFRQMLHAEWITGGDGHHDPTIAGDRLAIRWRGRAARQRSVR